VIALIFPRLVKLLEIYLKLSNYSSRVIREGFRGQILELSRRLGFKWEVDLSKTPRPEASNLYQVFDLRAAPLEVADQAAGIYSLRI
jgi:hypothetical protein